MRWHLQAIFLYDRHAWTKLTTTIRWSEIVLCLSIFISFHFSQVKPITINKQHTIFGNFTLVQLQLFIFFTLLLTTSLCLKRQTKFIYVYFHVVHSYFYILLFLWNIFEASSRQENIMKLRKICFAWESSSWRFLLLLFVVVVIKFFRWIEWVKIIRKNETKM